MNPRLIAHIAKIGHRLMPNLPRTPDSPSAVSLIDTQALARSIIRSGADPWPVFAAAVLSDLGHPASDLEALMAARGPGKGTA
jgi:hypothetical protein